MFIHIYIEIYRYVWCPQVIDPVPAHPHMELSGSYLCTGLLHPTFQPLWLDRHHLPTGPQVTLEKQGCLLCDIAAAETIRQENPTKERAAQQEEPADPPAWQHSMHPPASVLSPLTLWLWYSAGPDSLGTSKSPCTFCCTSQLFYVWMRSYEFGSRSPC